MGRRSRKRARRPPDLRGDSARDSADAGPAAARTGHGATVSTPRRRRATGEPPPAPWGGFPLVELCIFLGLVLAVLGFVLGARRGHVMVVAGVALASLASLELSIREHLAGYRSHTTLLAATVGVITLAVLFFLQVARGLMLGIGAAVFAAMFLALRELFKRRSGGLGFR